MRHVTQLIVYGSLAALAGGGPAIETSLSPAEECRLSAPCSFGDLWAPHGHEFDYGMSSAVTTAVSGESGASCVAPSGLGGRRQRVASCLPRPVEAEAATR